MAVNPTITPYSTPTTAYTVGQSDTAYVDLDLSDLTSVAELFVTCPLDAQVHVWTLTAGEVAVRWDPGGIEAALLTGGAWVGFTTVGPWSVAVSPGTPAVVSVSSPDPGAPVSGPLRLRITGIRTGGDGGTVTVQAQSNAATQRILADPTVVSAGTSVSPVVERTSVELVGNGAVSVQESGGVPASFGALPAVRGEWTRVSSNLAFALMPVGISNASFIAPGVHEPADEEFLFRAHYDLDASLAFTSGEPDNTESVEVTIEPAHHRMILVLDRSGSMSSPLTGGSESRWNATLKAAHAWLDLFSAFRAAEDQEAGFLTFEDDTCGYGAAATGADVTLRDPADGSTKSVLSSLATFHSLTQLHLGAPQSCTPIGDALVAAVQKLSTGPLTSLDALTIFLLTDGRENAGATTVRTSTVDAPGSSSTFLDQLNAYAAVKARLSVYALGLGSGTDEDTLNNLPSLAGVGAGGGGYYHLTTDTQALLDELETMMADSIDAQPTTVTVGVDDATFTVNDGERKLAVLVPWSNANDVVRLSHRAQDSTDPYQTLPAGPGVTSRSRATHGIAVVDIPVALSSLPSTARDWRVERLQGGPGGAPGPLEAAIAVVDLKVKAELTFDRVAYRTGEPMQLTCRVLHGRDPVLNATVTVKLDGPGQGVGTFLATNGQKVRTRVSLASAMTQPGFDLAGQAAAGGDPAAAKAALLDHFLRVNDLRELPRVTPLFADGSDQLFDDGAHGDGEPGDGVYANTFVATRKEGTYRFLVRVTGELAPGNRFDRTIAVSKWVGVRVAPGSSPVTVTAVHGPGDGQLALEVKVIPRDAAGEYLGPGRAGEVRMSASVGSFVGPVVSNIDGSYTATLHHPEGQEPSVTVSVGDVCISPVPTSAGDERCLQLFWRTLFCPFRKLIRWLRNLFA